MESTFLTHADFWQYVSLIVLGIVSLLVFLVFVVVKVFLKSSTNPELKGIEQRLEQLESQVKPSQIGGQFVTQQEFAAYLTAWRKIYQSFHAAEKVYKCWLEGRQSFNEANTAYAQRLMEQQRSIEASRPLLSNQVSHHLNEFLAPAKKLHKMADAHAEYLASIGTRAQYTDFVQYDSGKEKDSARRLLKSMATARLAFSSSIYQRITELESK